MSLLLLLLLMTSTDHNANTWVRQLQVGRHDLEGCERLPSRYHIDACECLFPTPYFLRPTSSHLFVDLHCELQLHNVHNLSIKASHINSLYACTPWPRLLAAWASRVLGHYSRRTRHRLPCSSATATRIWVRASAKRCCRSGSGREWLLSIVWTD